MRHSAVHKRPRLKKELTLLTATLYGVGIILGAGVYALIGEGAALAGNSLWLSFVVAAFISVLTGLSYAELSSMFPKEGAEYVFTKRAFNIEFLSFIIGWAFILASIIGASVVALGFAGYFSALFGTPIIPIAIAAIIALSMLNFYGMKESASFNVISTLIEMGGLVIIVLIGLNFMGTVNYAAAFDASNFSGIMAGAVLIFFAFLGFEDVANISEEAKHAKKIIPMALILSIVITTILYILVAVSAISILGWEALAASKAPLADVAAAVLGPQFLVVLSVIALFATSNTVLVLLIVSSRFLYGMSRERTLPGFLSKIHKKTCTPYYAIFITMIVAAIGTLYGGIGDIAEVTVSGTFIIFAAVNLSLIKMRYSMPKAERPFRSPISIGKLPVLALLGLISCVAMLFFFQANILITEGLILLAGVLVFIAKKKFWHVR